MYEEKIELLLNQSDKSEALFCLHNTVMAFHRMKVYSGELSGAKEIPYVREGLTKSVSSTLTKLHDLAESTMGHLADVLGFTASKTTRCVDVLIKNGLAERRFDENNRRVIIVKPTEKGFALTEENNKVIAENFYKLIEGIPESELAEMVDAYAFIIETYHKYCGLFITPQEFIENSSEDK